jgi:hypothetical protein
MALSQYVTALADASEPTRKVKRRNKWSELKGSLLTDEQVIGNLAAGQLPSVAMRRCWARLPPRRKESVAVRRSSQPGPALAIAAAAELFLNKPTAKGEKRFLPAQDEETVVAGGIPKLSR